MTGDERVRYCPQCKLDVYNFSDLTAAEVERIMARREGRLCARFYQRADGTMMTQNCPVRFRVVMQRVSRLTSAALAAVMSAGPAMAASTLTRHNTSLLQIQAAQNVLALEVVDVRGTRVPDAAITIVNEKTGMRIDTKTDAYGKLRFADLPVGTYEIMASGSEFKTLKLIHIAVPTRDPIKLQLEWGDSVQVLGGVMSDFISADALKSLPDLSRHHPSALRRFFSALRRMF
jgi:hypothetical protein